MMPGRLMSDKKYKKEASERERIFLEAKKNRPITTNECGIKPVEFKVIIRPDEQGETLGKLGLIFVPDTSRDKFALEKCEGVLIAIGGNAFLDWEEPKPQIGDRVYFAKYAGIRLKKDIEVDGKNKRIEYVLCNDKDIAAILMSDGIEANTAKPERKLT